MIEKNHKNNKMLYIINRNIHERASLKQKLDIVDQI